MDRRVRATPTLVRDYFRLFVNRRAYTLQSVRPHPESGRHYYFRPKERGSGAPLSLTEKTVSRHLEGEITIGLYAINPSSQRCKYNLAILVSDPRFYQCWAGCTKEMIRAALGHPIRVQQRA